MKYWICISCEEELELCEDNFHRDVHSDTGWNHKCKSCVNLYQQQYRSPHKEVVNKPAKRRIIPELSSYERQVIKDEKNRVGERTLSIYGNAF